MSTEFWAEIIFGSASLLISLIVAVIGYKLKAAIGEVRNEQDAVKAELLDYQRNTKEELVANQNDLKLDLTVKHTENKASFVAHAAEDARQFAAIEKTLIKIQEKLEDIS